MLVPVQRRPARAGDAGSCAALEALKPILGSRGLVGLVEPLGFEICSLRYKSEAVDAIAARGRRRVFKLVHDTFHHHLAGEAAIFPALTGLVHISGVDDPALCIDMRDPHRVLVTGRDRLGNVEQIARSAAAAMTVSSPSSRSPRRCRLSPIRRRRSAKAWPCSGRLP